MRYEKSFVGQKVLENNVIKYYIICKNNCYGVEIEEQKDHYAMCDYEYFTNSHIEANKVGIMLLENVVTLTSFVEILDDYVA